MKPGQSHTPEARAKCAAAKIGTTRSLESRAKQGATLQASQAAAAQRVALAASNRIDWTDLDPVLIEMAQARQSSIAIARRLGVCDQAVRKRRKLLGLPRSPYLNGRKLVSRHYPGPVAHQTVSAS